MDKNSKAEKSILKAAQKLLFQRGFYGVRMQEIADEAAVNKALLHYYFRSKESLFLKVFSSEFASLSSKLQKLLSPDLSLPERIRSFSASMMEYQGRGAKRLQFLSYSIHHCSELVSASLKDSPDLNQVCTQIQAGMDAGFIPKGSPNLVVHRLIQLCISYPLSKELMAQVLPLEGASKKKLELDWLEYLERESGKILQGN